MHARTDTRVPGTARGCALRTYPANRGAPLTPPPRPARLCAHRSAKAAGRPQPRAPPALPAQQPAVPPAPSGARAGTQATPHARDSPAWGFSAPTSWCPARLCSVPPVPLPPPRRRQAHLCSGREWAAGSEGPEAVSAIPGGSREKVEDARVAGPLGTAGLGWARLPLASARPSSDARPTSTKEWRDLPGQRRWPAI